MGYMSVRLLCWILGRLLNELCVYSCFSAGGKVVGTISGHEINGLFFVQ